MELSFATVALRDLFESRHKAIRVLGALGSGELTARIADLMASETAEEFFKLVADDIVMAPPDEVAVHLKSGFKFVLVSGHVKTPRASSGDADWSKVSRVKITKVEGPS